MNSSLDDFDDVLSALADPSRRSVLERLARSDGETATTLAAELPISRQAIVKHLVQLDLARLVESHRVGREVRYNVRPDRLAATAQGIEAIAESWGRTLEALKRVAEETEDSAPS